jgi:hypothetical protein
MGARNGRNIDRKGSSKPRAARNVRTFGDLIDLLYAFVIVRLGRRDLVWTNVTANPTAEWVARQITEAFPWDEAPHYLIRDRDRIYGSVVTRRLRAMGIPDEPTAPASPWQNGVVERLIGSIRRECVDHIIVLARCICARSCNRTHATTTTSERIDHWIRMRRSLVRFSGLESSVHTRYSADFIITTSVFRFSVHTGFNRSASTSLSVMDKAAHASISAAG